MPIASELVSVGIQSHRAQAFNGSYAFGVSAAGSTSQTNSTAITAAFTQVSTCASGNGVRLPRGTLGDVMWLRNDGAAACQVYPSTGGKINGGSANAKDATDLINTSGTASNHGSRRAYICVSASGLDWNVF